MPIFYIIMAIITFVGALAYFIMFDTYVDDVVDAMFMVCLSGIAGITWPILLPVAIISLLVLWLKEKWDNRGHEDEF